MAVDVCSDIPSPVVSPRISFSHDLKESDVVPVERYHRRSDALLLESSIDFDFCISQSFSQQVSSADELFANGKILPVEVKKAPSVKEIHQSEPGSRCSQQSSTKSSYKSSTNTAVTSKKTEKNSSEDTKKKMLKEFLSSSFDAEDRKPSVKPFWQFGRSSSLNCENGRSNGLIRSLQFLSRSNSTGSAPNPKPSLLPKMIHKQHSQKEPSIARSSSSASSSTQFYSYTSSKGRSLKKCYSSGVRINPVLNISPTNLSIGTVSLFGFCSFFSNSKSKKKNK